MQGSRLDDAPLVVPGFRPRIGEKDAHPVQRRFGEHAVQHFHTVAFNHADIIDAPAYRRPEQLSQARPVQLHGNDVGVGFQGCHGDGGGSGAAADFQDGGVTLPAEPACNINGLVCGVVGEFTTSLRPVLLPGFFLILGEGAASETDAPETRVITAVVKLRL